MYKVGRLSSVNCSVCIVECISIFEDRIFVVSKDVFCFIPYRVSLTSGQYILAAHDVYCRLGIIINGSTRL